MTRLFSSVRLALTLTMVLLCAVAVSVSGVSTGSGAATTGTPLPPAWELCVLQGLNAPLTADNVADLDRWQAAEGGSTNNTAAYNPFNTMRTTDVNGNPLPIDNETNGFPAYANWLAGCAGTVATLLQPNMWVITQALRAGNVSPPPAFLAIVDQSAWCAPSADGTPCYADAIAGYTSTLSSLPRSAALDVYGNVKSDLTAYLQDLGAVTADQAAVQQRTLDLATTAAGVASAERGYSRVEQSLGKFGVAEYVNSGLFEDSSFAGGVPGTPTFGHPNAQGVVAEQYQHVAESILLARQTEAQAALKVAQTQHQDAARALALAAATLTSDETTEHQALGQLVSNLSTMQSAGACTTVSLAASGGAGAPTGTTTTTNPAGTSDTTSTTSTTTSTTSTTSTTTTVAGPTPTVAVVPGSSGSTTTTSTTTTTTTVPPTTSTTTTTAPPTSAPTTTTTTTTTPDTGTGSTTPAAAPAGVTALQGCVTAFTPPAAA